LIKLLNLRIGALRCGSVHGGYVSHLTYALHEVLTEAQQDVLVKKLTQHMLSTCYSDDFVEMLLLACFEFTGRPRKESRLLYEWLLSNVYSSNVTHMIEDWLTATKKATP
jgi:hypothetical protein